MSRKTNATRNFNRSIVFPCVLKTMLTHTIDDDNTFTKNDKQVRAILRVARRDDHVKNTSWIFNNMNEYDNARRAYDRVYDAYCVERDERTKNERKQKRATPRAKANAKTIETTTSEPVE